MAKSRRVAKHVGLCSQDAESNRTCDGRVSELPSAHLALQRMEQSWTQRAVCSAIHSTVYRAQTRQGPENEPTLKDGNAKGWV